MSLVISIIFGAIGGVYFFHGRREHEPLLLVIGAALMFYPYFVSNVPLLLAIGIALVAVPLGRKRGWF